MGTAWRPDYLSGEIVTFSPLEVQRYGVIAGKDYAIQLDGARDGENTFKRVLFDPADASVFVLKCVNPRSKSPGKIKRERVIRMARAIWVSRPPAKGMT